MSLIKTTNRTIEVSEINADYMMPLKTNVQSVVFIPGIIFKGDNYVYIIENSIHAVNPVKAFLQSTITQTEPRMWIFNQRLQLGFTYLNGVFDIGAKVIFNIGELHFNRRTTNVRINVWSPEMKMKISQETAIP